jgi:C4-dicarboxylate transporter
MMILLITVIVVILLGRYAIKKGQELENKKR